MLPFGLLGFRPGQIWKPLFGYEMNFIPIFNYIITLLITINYFIVKKNYNDASNIFFAVFVVFISIKFTWLMYIFYKGYNLFNLIEDIHKTRKKKLGRRELIYIFITLIIILSVITYVIKHFSGIVVSVFRTGTSESWRPFSIKTSNPILKKIFVVLEFLVYLSVSWSSFFLTSFMILTIVIVLRTEFVHCVEELQNEIERNTSLSSEIFSETVQRFYKLTNILHKADNILSPIIGLNITICMVMLCGVVYKCLVGNCNFAQWNLPTITSVVILIILLPPVIATNNKVVIIIEYFISLLQFFLFKNLR